MTTDEGRCAPRRKHRSQVRECARSCPRHAPQRHHRAHHRSEREARDRSFRWSRGRSVTSPRPRDSTRTRSSPRASASRRSGSSPSSLSAPGAFIPHDPSARRALRGNVTPQSVVIHLRTGPRGARRPPCEAHPKGWHLASPKSLSDAERVERDRRSSMISREPASEEAKIDMFYKSTRAPLQRHTWPTRDVGFGH
jgi:hypothetical protein